MHTPIETKTLSKNAPHPTSRRRFLARCLGIGVGTALLPVAAFAQFSLQNGMYLGYWKDGRALMERVNVTNTEIRITRLAGGDVQGKTFVYIRSGHSTYNSPSGHQIYVTGPQSFTWTNSKGQNGVAYTRQ